MRRHLISSVTVFLYVLAVSCAGPKKTIYFKDNSYKHDSAEFVEDIKAHADATIHANDILAINISSESFYNEQNPSKIFTDGGISFSTISTTVGGSSGSNNAYLVDSSGNIDYPLIGKIRVGGYTIRIAKEQIAQQLKKYLKNPTVEVRIVNYRITVLGEVGRAGVIYAPNHKMTIIDAIASSGDIPVTGRKDNILIIREINGKREHARINLNSRDVFNSPYYYLRQNDIVYVEQGRVRRQENNEFLRIYLPTVTTLLSTVLAVYGIVQISKQ